ncbi:MAG: hypothetical protein AMJ46_12580 [Latescibacteria bacterium DG_63]|nr:MAG: hypothetical protein AMJ46_12580 [Latescibacteria bacterium DG_63]
MAGWRERLARRLAPKAQGEQQEVHALYRMLLGKTPTARNTAELIAAYKQVPQFRSVVAKIADHVASVHWRLYAVRSKSGKAKHVRTGQIIERDERKKELARYKRQGELEEVQDHPFARMLDIANDEHSGFEARRLTQIYLDVVGESFWNLQRGAFNQPTAYWPLPPHWIRQTPSLNKQHYEIKISGRSFFSPVEDMLWFRDLDPVEPYGRGSGLGESLGDEIDTTDYAAKYVKAFFYNRAKPDMMVGIEGASPEEIKRTAEGFRQQHLGYNRAHRAYFHGGKMDVKELNSRFDELKIVELQGSLRDAFVHTFGIPPEVLGILTNSNRSTVREALRFFASETVVPRCERLRLKQQQRLIPMYDERLILEYDSPVPEDDEFELNAMKAAPHYATRGEWREMQGLEHRGEIDDIHYVPVNLIPQSPTSAAVVELSTGPAVVREPILLTQHKDDDQVLVNRVLEDLRPERMKDEMYALHRHNMQEWGDEVLDELGVAVGFDLINPLTAEFFDNWENNKIKLINETTRNNLNRTLIEGVRAGEGIPDLSKRVTSVFDLAKGYRAERIARTEVLGASNHATYAAHKISGVVQQRQWVATYDGNARDEHERLGIADPVGLDEPFVVDNYSAMYPGEFGAPEMDINCRCTTVAVIGEPKEAKALGEVWKIYDRRLVPWENAMRAAAKRAFDTQRREVNAAVRRVFA